MAIRHKDVKDSPTVIDHILHPLVKGWFHETFDGFSLPQLLAVLPIHNRENILVSAPTGATKTLTAFMSVLNELVDSAYKGILEDKVYAVYISPLKALNYDIQVNLLEPLRRINESAGKDLGIRVDVRTGDTTQSERARMSRKPPHILITTPESLAIMLNAPKFSLYLQGTQWCIIDEIHALAENKRGAHLSLSIERLQRLAPSMTRVGLSATIAPLDEVASYLVGSGRDCIIVDVQFMKDLDLKVLSPVADLINTPYPEIHERMYGLIHSLIEEHKTTLIFTNTRAATERVVDHLKDRYPGSYNEGNIGAHHGSLSKEHRHHIESSLREGKLKCVVCSTSLELGIDIGFIDLVILLGSPKSVARALQRTGRSGHRLKARAKGRIIVMDRDDLVECAVLLRSALHKKIDTIHIPENALDVLAQHILGIALQETMSVSELSGIIRKSYCYRNIPSKDIIDLLLYLSGSFAGLEERHIYARIWYDEEKQMVGRKGRMSRVIYMTNIGTIPDETQVLVKVGTQVVGSIEEGFLEKLRPGDVFVLGGSTYEFRFARGMVAQVIATTNRPPTVPRWFSESLPLSYDLALAIGHFRALMAEKVNAHLNFPQAKRPTKEDITGFINSHLSIDEKGALAIYSYFLEQFLFLGIPSDRKMIIESYFDGSKHHYIFHALFGRRVNDCLSRAVAFAISRMSHRDVEIGINDNGFVIATTKPVQAAKAFSYLNPEKIGMVMEQAIERTEVFKRRFRHCASRSLMILRNYGGRQKNVGRQQVSSTILMNALKRIDPDFSILREARREVLYDQMDLCSAIKVLAMVKDGKITVEEKNSPVPSPFAFNLYTQGLSDILRIEDRAAFVQRMHGLVLAKISLKGGSGELAMPSQISTADALRQISESRITQGQSKMLSQVESMGMSDDAKRKLVSLIRTGEGEEAFFEELSSQKEEIGKWPSELGRFVLRKIYLFERERFTYEERWAEDEKEKEREAEEEKEALAIEFRTAAKRVHLDPQIQYDFQELIDDPKKTSVRDETRVWMDGLLNGPVPKIWTDRLVKYLKKRRKELS